MKMARPGETLDMTEPPSEAFDRREVVVLTGETARARRAKTAAHHPHRCRGLLRIQ